MLSGRVLAVGALLVVAGSRRTTDNAPSVPDDAFWAYGYRDQYVAVVPSEGVVAVRWGARPATPDALTFEGFTHGVLEGLGAE